MLLTTHFSNFHTVSSKTIIELFASTIFIYYLKVVQMELMDYIILVSIRKAEAI